MQTPSEDLLPKIMPKNAGAHNSIYRGKDITNLFYNGTLSQQISAGTFDDIFVGDYIIGNVSNRKYFVADINYRFHSGNVLCNTFHVLIIPEKVLGTSAMNDSNTVEGAYVGSKMYSEILASIKNTIESDFELSHILAHKNYFCNAVTGAYESNGDWYNSTIDLMNENMVYGSNIYHNFRNGTSKAMNITIDKTQLALFRLRPDLIVSLKDSRSIQKYWLRDVASESAFCLVGGGGSANNAGASEVQGIRPAFLIY